MKRTLALLLALALCFSVMTGAAFAAEEAPAVDYDALSAIQPTPAKTVVFLRGTWEEMGRQYAEARPAQVEKDIVSGLASTLPLYEGSVEAAWEGSQKALADAEAYMPEALDFLRGVAEGSGHSFEEVVLTYGIQGATPYCNSLSAWGEATGGDALLGSNSDVGGTVMDDPTLILYPEDPAYPASCHAVMTSNGFLSNGLMNDLGLCMALTGGQTAQEGDTDPEGGIGAHFSQLFIMARSGSYEELKDDVIAAPYATGVNTMLLDAEGNGCVVEQTAAACAVREHHESVEGDVDYMIENNCYFSEDMFDHDYHDGTYDDCPYRYETVKYYLDRDMGQVTVDTIREAMASRTYVDTETGLMSGEPVWVNDIEGYFSPENVAPHTKTAARMILNATTLTAYILNGPEDPLVSPLPGALGTYYRLALLPTEYDVTADAQNNAYLYVFQATRDISLAGEEVSQQRMDLLNEAKRQLHLGDNYMSFVGFDPDAELELYSKAASAYVLAQAYAKAAWDEPHTLFSDYEDAYFVF